MPKTLEHILTEQADAGASDDDLRLIRDEYRQQTSGDPMTALKGASGMSSDTWTDRAVRALPNVGGFVGGVAGSTRGRPIKGAILGGAGGRAIEQLINRARGRNDLIPQTRAEAAQDITAAGATQGIREGAGRVLIGGGSRLAGRALERLAPRMVQAAVKPTVSQLRQQSGASMAGVQDQARRLTNILLRNRWTKPDQAADAVRTAEGQLQTELARNTTPLDTATRIPQYLASLQRSASAKIAPGSDPAAIRGVGRDVLEHGSLSEDVTTMVPQPAHASAILGPTGQPIMRPTPPVAVTSRAMRTDVTPAEGLTAARAQGRWRNRGAWGELKGAELEGSKAVERAVRDSVKDTVPSVRPLLRQQRDALTALPVLDRMAHRTANRDTVGLPAWVMAGPELAAGKVPFGAMVAQYLRNQQLPLGYRAQDVGRKLSGVTGQLPSAALAWMDALAGSPTEQTLRDFLENELKRRHVTDRP